MEKEKEKVETKETVKENTDFWTTEERNKSRSEYGCEILISNGSVEDVRTKKAPNDALIVKYNVDNRDCYDLTRGSRTSVFDMYWDKFKGGLKSINYGMGTIKPNLWGYTPPSKSKKRKG